MSVLPEMTGCDLDTLLCAALCIETAPQASDTTAEYSVITVKYF